MRIVNKKKFIRSIGIIISLVIFIILLLINTSFSHTEINYKQISVINGDSLWNIAKYEQGNNPYFYNKTTRDIVTEIKCINHLDTSDLKVGDQLTIPTI